MSRIDNPNSGNGPDNKNPIEKAVNEGRRRFLIVAGSILGGSQILAYLYKHGGESVVAKPDGEKYEIFMGVKLTIVTPNHTPNNLPELQQSLMKKPGAEYDKHTGNVLYGTPAKYIMDEPVVEFEHTLIEGYNKTFKGKLRLKISAAKALIQAEKELGEPIPVREGIRSNQKQQLWYERNNCLGDFSKPGCEKRPYPTAPPGLSEHEKGQAIDIDTRQRAKYKKILLKYGFLDDTRQDPPHFTFKAIPFSAADYANSKENDEYVNSPAYKKWIMRKEKWLEKKYKEAGKKLSDVFKHIKKP